MENTWGWGLGMPQPRGGSGVGVPYLFESAWELLSRVPRALADQAGEQGRNLLWPQGTQSVVKHELSEE